LGSYDADFYSWTIAQSAALREGRWTELDLAHLAEEIEDLGKEQFSKLESALRLILMHLLKWDLQPDRRSRSWVISIRRERMNYLDVLRDNPGLKPRRDEALDRAYGRARLDAAEETELPMKHFPVECPYTFGDILDRSIEWPDT
jgi:predicted DNA-binding ribbon-helix-helix protein